MEPTQTLAGVVEVFDDAIADCHQIIALVESLGLWQDSSVGLAAGIVDKSIRDNQVAIILPFSFRTPLPLYLFARNVWEYLDDYATRHNTGFSAIEPFNVNKYEPGERYKPHADAGPGSGRHISALVYLNDVEVGGETLFTYFNEAITPKAGRLIIFPSNYAYTHAALPPGKGVKYSAAFWCHE